MVDIGGFGGEGERQWCWTDGEETHVYSHFLEKLGGAEMQSGWLHVIWPWKLRGGERVLALVRREMEEMSEVGEMACWMAGLRFVVMLTEQTEKPRSEPSLCGLG